MACQNSRPQIDRLFKSFYLVCFHYFIHQGLYFDENYLNLTETKSHVENDVLLLTFTLLT